jgi:hypothetical protein
MVRYLVVQTVTVMLYLGRWSLLFTFQQPHQKLIWLRVSTQLCAFHKELERSYCGQKRWSCEDWGWSLATARKKSISRTDLFG